MTRPPQLRIDPHTHSTCSDGTNTPEELLLLAAQAELDVLGLVDHDTFNHYQPASQAWHKLKNSGQKIPSLLLGMEISCQLQNGAGVHLLAYLPRENGSALRDLTTKAQQARKDRILAMVDLLSKRYPITWADVARNLKENQTPGRPHLADTLIRKGIFPDRCTAFSKVLNKTSPYYVPRWSPTPIQAIEATLADGGVPVLAHPFARRGGDLYLDENDIADMKQAGLLGMEVWHRDHDQNSVKKALIIAKRLCLAASGSSDFHGAGKPNLLGENLMPEQTLTSIIERGAHPFLATDFFPTEIFQNPRTKTI